MNGKMNFFLDPKNRVIQKSSIMNYKQDQQGLYLVANKKFINWMDVHTYCHTCLSALTFDDEFDASYCSTCNEWREEKMQRRQLRILRKTAPTATRSPQISGDFLWHVCKLAECDKLMPIR
nr:hypothetical protein [Planococcus glaciei]